MFVFNPVTFELVGSYTPQKAIDGSDMLRPNSTDSALAKPFKEGFVQKFKIESKEGNLYKGKWEQLEDNRGKDCFDTSTAEKSEIDYIGSVKDGFTLLEPDCEFPVWDGDNWICNEVKKLERDSYVEKAWRDSELSLTDRCFAPDYPGRNKQAILAYRKELRDWPSSESFPDPEKRPVWPDIVPRPAV